MIGAVSDTRVSLNLDGREFILIGTAHVSRGSIDEVSGIIREERPDLICVELDEGRYGSITQKESWENLNMVKVFREGKGFLLLANLVLSGFQRRMGAELGVKPGEEMKAALDIAKELGIPHALCDREVQVTLRRAWASCGIWNKSKLLATLLTSAFTTEKISAEEIEELKNRNELDGMMNELADYLPEVKETLIDERDSYLAAKIWENARKQGNSRQDGSPQRIVAVVGAGHIQGIRNQLESIARAGSDPDISVLNAIPSRGVVSKALPFLIPLVILALFVSGFVRGGAGLSLSMLRQYILWNGSLAALGAIIALGHPLAILTAFLAAPITTFTPFIGVGLFSGAVQAILQKPRVADAQTLIDDVGSLKGFYRNRITRALLVFFLSQLGGALGTFVTIPALTAGLFR
ncbi:MAG: TraB/GumN family protein [Treponema sp.]|jgi:pheromone shutdown-related protein TraB|nr:TraB/GumN family protein [Treponema sp.]